MSTRTILFVDASPSFGGATRVLLDILAALDPEKATGIVACRAGSSVEEAVRTQGATTVPMVLPTLTFAGGPWGWATMATQGLSAIHAITELIRSRRPALVHGGGLASTLLAGVPSRGLGVPLVWHAHDNLDRRARNVPAVRAAGAMARSIVCVSQASRQRLLELGVGAGKCRVLYGAVPERSRPSARKTGAPVDSRPTILAVGTITRQKGQHVLVEAASILVRRYPEVLVAIAGEAMFDRDQAYLRDLQADVARRGLTGHVRFLGFRDDVPDLIEGATIVAHPSAGEETFGLVPLEAMAAGRPVVATRIGGLGEVVEAGVSGFLVEPGSSDELAEALALLLGDPGLRGRMGEAGRQIAAERFGAASMRRGLDEIFSAILGASVVRVPG